MATLLLARHGETDWNRTRRWQGSSDTPLNEAGREQARALAKRLEGEEIASVYASDLRRARETAEPVAVSRGLAVTSLRALREVDFGSWEGLTRDEIGARFPEAYGRWSAYEGPGWDGGETHEQMAQRVLGALQSIADAHAAGDTVLVVTHGGPIRAVLAHTSGVSDEEERRAIGALENCDFIRVEVAGGRLEIRDQPNVKPSAHLSDDPLAALFGPILVAQAEELVRKVGEAAADGNS